MRASTELSRSMGLGFGSRVLSFFGWLVLHTHDHIYPFSYVLCQSWEGVTGRMAMVAFSSVSVTSLSSILRLHLSALL